MPTTVSTTNGLISAVDNANSGDVVVVEDTTYNFDGEWRITSDGITIEPASGRPHFVFSGRTNGDNRGSDGIKVYAENATIRGFEISDSAFKGIYTARGHGTTFEDLVVHDCWHTGIMNNGSQNVTFRNCDSYNNYGNFQSADGFNMTGNSSNMARDNLLEGCRSWNNADDGYDMFASENNTIRNCWSWNNGREEGTGNGNGFKLGRTDPLGGGHTVEGCVAYNNRSSGFWWNGEDDNTITVRHCTAYNNPINYAFNDIAHRVENCISYAGYTNDIGKAVDDTTVSPDCDGTQNPMCGIVITDPAESVSNSWDHGIVDPGFRSTDPKSPDFLRLTEDSPARGMATDGSDLGAFQYTVEDGSSVSPIVVDGATTLDASDAETSSSKLESEHSGFNGSGYLNPTMDEGSSVRWPLDVTAAGRYNFEIRFANGGSSDRTASMSIGGSRQDITFPQTSGWADWSTVTGTIDLASGLTDIVIETTGQDAGNVDQISFQPVEDSGPGGETGDTPNHGYNTPDKGQSDWHKPLNENFVTIDQDVPVVDTEGAKDNYDAADGTLYFAIDTGAVYVGDGSQWNQLGTLN